MNNLINNEVIWLKIIITLYSLTNMFILLTDHTFQMTQTESYTYEDTQRYYKSPKKSLEVVRIESTKVVGSKSKIGLTSEPDNNGRKFIPN